MKRIIIFVQSPKTSGFISLQCTFPKITQKVLTTFQGLELITVILITVKLSKNITLEENFQKKQQKKVYF